MVDELVLREQLTGDMIEAGETLTRALDASGTAVSGSFWLYLTESER